MPKVRVLRPFANEHHDDIVQPGDEIAVTEDREKDLGELVERIGTKAERAPDNKMAPEPANKAAGRRSRT